MARISLRAYNRDIEAIIDGNQIDEAFAHCRNILESYPKNIDTYRLMGKALLEAQRFSDASDVFHRVLSSVPDDFIAHLGMSIIREDESNLDAAIWHMERSFEVQPSNAAVQVELRRLYGLRDGLTPQKIQLTRGALARMSAKSNLFTQAIAELRTALSNDPQRPDLQVVLAEMYAQTGARMEAIETCNSLISKLPYCLVANRLLAEILPNTERAERAQEYKERLAELDPYYAHLSPVALSVDQVPDGAVTIQRLDYSGEELEALQSTQPEWATSLGVTLDEEMEIEEQTPEWLGEQAEEKAPIPGIEPEDDREPEPVPSAEDESELVPSETTEAEPIPEWINEVDHPEITDTQVEQPTEAQDTAPVIPFEEPPSDAEAEQLPEWMSEAEEPVESDTPNWLRDAMEEAPEENIPLTEVAAVAGVAAVLPADDQESKADAQDSEEEITPITDIGEEESEEVESLVEVEPDESGEPIEEPAIGEVGVTAGIVAGAAVAGAVLGASKDEEEDQQDDAQAEMHPDSDQLGKEELESELAHEGSLPETDPDIPDWLQDLGEDLPTPPEEPDLQEEPTESEELISPAAVPETDIEEIDLISAVEESPTDIEGTPDIVSGMTAEDEPIDSEFPETIPDWLSKVSPEGVPDLAMQDAALDDGEIGIVQAEIPEWLRKMEQEHEAELAAAGEAENLKALEFDSDFTELTGADVPSWLMTAMETEDISAADEISAVEDIGEILSEPAEEPLPAGAEIEDEIILEQVEEDAITAGIETEEVVAAAALTDGIVSEQLEDEHLTEEIETEEVTAAEEGEQIAIEPVEGIGEHPELAAAGAIAEEVVLDGDTQPVVVADEVEPREEAEGEIPVESEISDFDMPSGTEGTEAKPLSEGEPLTEVDEDAAMAWLESLAAKQGAAEDELLTPPEERLEEPPEWVQEAALEDEVLEEAEAEEDKVETAAAAALASVAAGALISEEEEDDEQAAVPTTDPSEWVPEITEEPEITGEPADEEVLSLEDVEPEIAEVTAEVLEPDPEVVPPMGEGEDELEVDEEFVSPTEEDLVQEEELEQPPEDIPEWLSGLTEEEAEVEVPAEWTPTMLTEEEIKPDVIEAPSDVKIDLNAASLAQLEKFPGIGFIHAQRIVNYRAESGPFKDLDDLQKVPGLTSEMIEDLHDYLTVEVVTEAAPPISTHPELQEAWNSVNGGEIDAAVDQYAQLINRDEHLDEIIRDLQEALGRYPQDAALYQSLGDAYLHANMLQEALDAYNRAEDLII